MSERPLIIETQLLLKITGFVCSEPNLWSNIRKTMILFITFVSYIDVIVWTIINRSEPDVLEGYYALMGLTQICLKMTMTIYEAKNVLRVISIMEEFWTLNKYGPRQEIISQKIFTITKFFGRCLMGSLSVICFLCAIQPFVVAEKRLPYPSSLFKLPEMFYAGYIFELLVFIVLVPGLLGFDFIYISLITNIICELQLLKIGFSEILISRNSDGDRHTMRVLKELIDHHNVVLECSSRIKDIFYIPLLGLFLTIVFAIGFCLINVISNGNFTDIVAIRYIISALFYIALLFIYCYPGTILTSENAEISVAVYQTDWWVKTQPDLRRAYVMIMQKANKPVVLSAGGIINVSLEAFTTILQKSLSFFAFVQTMYNNDL